MVSGTFRLAVVSTARAALLIAAGAAHGYTTVEYDRSVGAPSTQGWLSDAQLAAPLTETAVGAMYEMSTVGLPGTSVGPMHLWYRAAPIGPGEPFSVEFDLQVVDDTLGHNNADAGIAFLVEWTGPGFLGGTGRASMIYFDDGEIGFGDLSDSFVMNTTVLNNYRIDVSAAGNMNVYVNGTLALSRTGVAPTGFLAFGDQTNDAGVDGQFRIDDIRLTTASCRASDLNGDSVVDGADLAALLAAWGPCP